MTDQPFDGRTVVVTGGGTGIGRATALAFAGLGAATVIVTGRRKDRLDAAPATPVYSANKAALHSFTWSWAAELSGRGIRANAVAPGFVSHAPMRTPRTG